MIVAQLVRNGNFILPLTPREPFIFASVIGLRKVKTAWSESCDDLFDVTNTVNAKQVARDYLTKYLRQSTIADMEWHEGSWYFDKATGIVLVHVEHDQNPVASKFDYGYAFGVSEGELVYIEDYEYLPLIKDSPELDRETDYANSDQPTGSTGSLVMHNECFVGEDGVQIGMLDFLLTEPIWGNDVFIFDYDGTTLTPLTFKYIQDISISEQEVEIELQDRRFS